MNEKIFKTMGRVGGGSIAMGIIMIITGLAVGVLMLVSGVSLLRRRAEITF